MIDIETHRIIDMISSRDLEDVATWLKTFPNLQIFSRDGSIIYRNAINQAHQNNLQVSDRFHIFKTLTTYASDGLRKALKSKVSLVTGSPKLDIKQEEDLVQDFSSINHKLTFEEKSKQALQYLNQGKTKSWICQNLKMDSRTLNKLINLSETERNQFFQTNADKHRQERREKKESQIKEVRDLFQRGLNYTEIARKVGLCRQTVKKYMDTNFQIEHAALGSKRGSILIAYHEEIHTLFEKGWMATKIADELRKKGCTASISTITHYISRLKKQKKEAQLNGEKPIETKMISRGKILNLLFHPIEESKVLIPKQFEEICEQYPIVKKIYSIVWSFKLSFHNKDVNQLLTWIAETKQLNIREMNSFINGLERDLEAVKNAVIYQYNNGLAEGSVNKVKLIKRIMSVFVI